MQLHRPRPARSTVTAAGTVLLFLISEGFALIPVLFHQVSAMCLSSNFPRGLWVGMILCAAVSSVSFAEPPKISATFSIVAVDPDQGLCGAAVASKYPDVGHVVPYVRADVGAFCTQHYHVPDWGPKVLDQLAAGHSPAHILDSLLAQDDESEQRQLAIIDIRGRVAQHNPSAAPPSSRYWGSLAGRHFACQGNTLAGREVIVAMGNAFEGTDGTFADKLAAALWAADQAGGDHRGRLAAGILIAKSGTEGHWFELHSDQSDDAVRELIRSYLQQDHPCRGAWRPADLDR